MRTCEHGTMRHCRDCCATPAPEAVERADRWYCDWCCEFHDDGVCPRRGTAPIRIPAPEAVERVAKALYEANVTAQAEWDHSVRVYPDAIETYRHLARAAIAALRGAS